MPGKEDAKIDNLLQNFKTLLKDIKEVGQDSGKLGRLVSNKIITDKQGLFRALINLITGNKSRYDKSDNLPEFNKLTKEVWGITIDIYKNILNLLKDLTLKNKITKDIQTIIESLNNRDSKDISKQFNNLLCVKNQRSASVQVTKKPITNRPNTATPLSNRVKTPKITPKLLATPVNNKRTIQLNNRSQTTPRVLNSSRSQSCSISTQPFATPINGKIKASSLMPPPATALVKRKPGINSTEYEYDKSKQFLHDDKIRQQRLKLIEARHAAAEAKRIEAKNALSSRLCKNRGERAKQADINREKIRTNESKSTNSAASKIVPIKLPELRKVNKAQEILKHIKDYISFIEDKMVKLNAVNDVFELDSIKSEVKRYKSEFGIRYPNSINLPAKKGIDKKYQELVIKIENTVKRQDRYEQKVSQIARSPQKEFGNNDDLLSQSVLSCSEQDLPKPLGFSPGFNKALSGRVSLDVNDVEGGDDIEPSITYESAAEKFMLIRQELDVFRNLEGMDKEERKKYQKISQELMKVKKLLNCFEQQRLSLRNNFNVKL
jgi:hypothetical protein